MLRRLASLAILVVLVVTFVGRPGAAVSNAVLAEIQAELISKSHTSHARRNARAKLMGSDRNLAVAVLGACLLSTTGCADVCDVGASQ